jgi:hypothetical protein
MNNSDFNLVLRKLSVGDTVYEESPYFDYFPQIILDIDLEQNKLYVWEESINKEKWIDQFSLLEKGKYVFYYISKVVESKVVEPKIYYLSVL